MRTVFTVLALGAIATAHDFWIEPKSFTPETGKVLEVRLKVGDFGNGENVPRSEQRIVRFVVAGADGEKPLVGRDGQEVAGLARIDGEGVMLLGYQSNHAFVEIAAKKFESYLVEKGLDGARTQRAERGETAQPAREIYSRCAKALLRVGESKGGHDRVLGLPLEIVPENDPAELAGTSGAARKLRVKVLWRGAPLANALVGALTLDRAHSDAGDTLFARTDAEGRAVLELPEGRRWLVAAVHMQRAGENEKQADWESLWASLTFEIPAPGSQEK